MTIPMTAARRGTDWHGADPWAHGADPSAVIAALLSGAPPDDLSGDLELQELEVTAAHIDLNDLSFDTAQMTEDAGSAVQDLISWYLREIGSTPLLIVNAAINEEAALAERMERGVAAANARSEACAPPSACYLIARWTMVRPRAIT